MKTNAVKTVQGRIKLKQWWYSKYGMEKGTCGIRTHDHSGKVSVFAH